MSNRVIQALWDADENRVALFLNPLPRFARYRAYYHVFLTDLASPGHPRDFLGVFDATLPTAADWAKLPPWILLPVPAGATSFAIDLVPKPRGDGAGDSRASDLSRGPHIEFDSSVAFDFRRRATLDEERHYCWFAETTSARGKSTGQRRQVDFRGTEIEQGQDSPDDLVDTLVESAGRSGLQITALMGFSIRDKRIIGPAKSLLGQSARRPIQVLTEFGQEPLPTLDILREIATERGQSTDSIDTKAYRSIAIDPESYEQPRLTLRLGSSERGAVDLKNRITFLHIPTNAMSALRALDPRARGPGQSPDPEAAKRAAWVDRLLKATQPRGSRDPLALLFDPQRGYVIHGADIPLVQERRGTSVSYLLQHDFKEVSMGDIVSVFVHDRVQLEYQGHATEAGDDSRSKSSFSSANFRFLINRFEPMDARKLIEDFDEEIALVVESVKQRLLEREEVDADAAVEPVDVAGAFAATPAGAARKGLRISELMWPAMEQQILAEDRRRPNGKAGRMLEVIGAPQFHRLPHVAHALCASKSFGDRVKAFGGTLPPVDAGFCATVLHVYGSKERTRHWLKTAPAADQQATVWEMFEVSPNLLEPCADLAVVIPEYYPADSEMLRELLKFFSNPAWLERATRILVDFDHRDEAQRLHDEASRLWAARPSDGAAGPSLEDLDVIVRMLRRATELLREEVDLIGPILAACRLPVEAVDPEHILVGTGADPQRIWALRDRAANILERKVSPLEQGAILNELRRLRSIGVLEYLVEKLEIVDQRSEILRVVIGTAEALTTWANVIADRSAHGAHEAAQANFGEDEWDAVRQSMRGKDVVPDSVRIARLAENRHATTANTFAPAMSLCAAGLQNLLLDAQRDARNRLGAAARRADKEFEEQFVSLERYASAALATLTARQLRDSAADIYVRVSRLPHNSGIDIPALTDSWNGLGRALAPDRAMGLLPDALRHAETILGLLAPYLSDPTGGASAFLNLPPPPTYAEVRSALPA